MEQSQESRVRLHGAGCLRGRRPGPWAVRVSRAGRSGEAGEQAGQARGTRRVGARRAQHCMLFLPSLTAGLWARALVATSTLRKGRRWWRPPTAAAPQLAAPTECWLPPKPEKLARPTGATATQAATMPPCGPARNGIAKLPLMEGVTSTRGGAACSACSRPARNGPRRAASSACRRERAGARAERAASVVGGPAAAAGRGVLQRCRARAPHGWRQVPAAWTLLETRGGRPSAQRSPAHQWPRGPADRQPLPARPRWPGPAACPPAARWPPGRIGRAEAPPWLRGGQADAQAALSGGAGGAGGGRRRSVQRAADLPLDPPLTSRQCTGLKSGTSTVNEAGEAATDIAACSGVQRTPHKVVRSTGRSIKGQRGICTRRPDNGVHEFQRPTATWRQCVNVEPPIGLSALINHPVHPVTVLGRAAALLSTRSERWPPPPAAAAFTAPPRPSQQRRTRSPSIRATRAPCSELQQRPPLDRRRQRRRRCGHGQRR